MEGGRKARKIDRQRNRETAKREKGRHRENEREGGGGDEREGGQEDARAAPTATAATRGEI